MAWSTHSQSCPTTIGVISAHCDIKTCLFELANIVNSPPFLISFVPCSQGGVSFYSDGHTMKQHALKAVGGTAKVDCDFSGIVSSSDHIKVIHSYVFVNSYYIKNDTSQQFSSQLESLRIMYQRFEMLFNDFSDEAKRDLVKDLFKLAIDSSLKPDNTSATVNIYHAAIIANSLISPMIADDYKMMITLFLNYFKNYEEIQSGTTAKRCGLQNLLTVISVLNPDIQQQISKGIDLLKQTIDSTSQLSPETIDAGPGISR